ncbi:MAG: hypothetical protein Q8N18_06975 [Opitutaceae bacterium]|nr:hypothetical protein [Opitutaceae bacterium]
MKTMTELRHTDTNAADDSAGRAFGLEGNLYLPVLLAVIGALVLFAILGVLLRINYVAAGGVVAVPLAVVVGWALLLKQGKPAGYDRDLIETLMGGGNFTRESAEQGRLLK